MSTGPATWCFSPTPALRCVGLTHAQTIAFLIPSAVAVLFAVAIVYRKRNDAKFKHLLLFAEILVYFLLSLAEFAIHLVPNLSLKTFKVWDILLGATSGIPLLCYTLFLLFFARSALLPDLPQRFRRIMFSTLVFFIPTIIITNAMGSFVGVRYSKGKFAESNTPTLAMGLVDETTSTFLNSWSIALLTSYQAIVFCLTFYRLMKALIEQRQIETLRETDSRGYLFKGLGWIAAGIKLGAIETVTGFAGGIFIASLLRRIFRLLGRACLVIGLIRGLDVLEDFTWVDAIRGSSGGNGGLRARIGNPRYSTFVRLDGGGENMLEKGVIAVAQPALPSPVDLWQTKAPNVTFEKVVTLPNSAASSVRTMSVRTITSRSTSARNSVASRRYTFRSGSHRSSTSQDSTQPRRNPTFPDPFQDTEDASSSTHISPITFAPGLHLPVALPALPTPAAARPRRTASTAASRTAHPSQRVTVHIDALSGSPQLAVRLSAIELGSPFSAGLGTPGLARAQSMPSARPVPGLPVHPAPQFHLPIRARSERAAAAAPEPSTPLLLPLRRPLVRERESALSVLSSDGESIRALAAQFPAAPIRSADDAWASISRPTPPRAPPRLITADLATERARGLGRHRSTRADVPVSAVNTPSTAFFTIVKEEEAGVPPLPHMGHVKSIGVVPRQRTPTVTSGFVQRESVPIEHFFPDGGAVREG